jgi:hypothetical protein
MGDKFFGRNSLFLLGEVGYQQLLACVSEGTETAARAALGLVTEALSEELWMVKKFSSTMAMITVITFGTCSCIVKLLHARLSFVAGL